MHEKLLVTNLFDTAGFIGQELLDGATYPWEVLPLIKDYVLWLGKTLDKNAYYKIADNVWISNKAIIAENAVIYGPTIICEDTEVRPSAFIRGNVLIGKNCVIGNSTELKNSIVMDGAQLPHYNYVGDSIIGKKAHLGAGAVTSNLKSDKTNVTIKFENGMQTGMRKIGAFVADGVEVGCNSVLCPGTIVAKGTSIYPLSLVRGYIPENSIVKQNIIISRRD